jgi:flavin reductase (DIM6/NTAB) family NADH-FMN oxidoreductase RutF
VVGGIALGDRDRLGTARGQREAGGSGGCDGKCFRGAQRGGIILASLVPEAADPAEFRRAMGLVPTAVTVVTAPGPDGPSGATANAVVSLSLEPPLMLAALDRQSRTLASLRSAGAFGVSVLSAGQDELAHRFATKDPHPVKWDGVAWRELAGVPAIEGATVSIACSLRDLLEGGDHAIVTGEVAGIEIADEAEPLVFSRGEYRPLPRP